MSAVLAPLRRRGPGFPDTVPTDIEPKLRRGREARDKDKNLRELCHRMWRSQGNDHYYKVTPAGGLTYQQAGDAGVVAAGKPVNRIRNTYPWIQMLVEAKVSAATGQIPGYEVTPATDDPEDEAAAALAAQVAVYGYDKWRIRRHATKAITSALVTREGFAMAYYDPNVGSYVTGLDGQRRPQGEVRIRTFTRDQVGWEPGEDFEDSRWYLIDREMLCEDIAAMPGHVPGSLDRREGGNRTERNPGDRVTLTEYLERPCPKYPEGRRMFFVYGRPVSDYSTTDDAPEGAQWWEPYPLMDAQGVVADEPPMQRISYTVNPDPEGDDLGLVERLIDCQRTITDCNNKLLEIKNRALLLQMVVPKGSGMPRRDDTPGATYEFNAAIGKPEWEPPPNPGFIAQLIQLKQEMQAEIRTLAADVDIQAQPRLAEGTAQLAQSTAQGRWESFLGDLAEFHSRLMRNCLTLVARYYDTQRQVDIRGQYGWQSIADFSGQDLRSQVNVRVLPGSLATKSRQAIQAEIQFIQANWPGAISPQAALATLHGGSGEGLIRSYRNDVSKAWRIVRRLQTGPNAMESFPPRFDATLPNPNFVGTDPMTGEPLVNPQTGKPEPQFGADVPGWMPAQWDNIAIWRQVFGDYMKTEDFERRDPMIQHAFQLVWEGLDEAEQQRAAKQAAQQQMQAQSLGMSNAGRPQMPPPLPDRAGFTPENQSPVPAPA